jgi:hypothetical protein
MQRPLVPAPIVPWNRQLDSTNADALEEWEILANSTHDNGDGQSRDLFSQSGEHRAQINQVTQRKGVVNYKAGYFDLFLEYQLALFVVAVHVSFPVKQNRGSTRIWIRF